MAGIQDLEIKRWHIYHLGHLKRPGLFQTLVTAALIKTFLPLLLLEILSIVHRMEEADYGS